MTKIIPYETQEDVEDNTVNSDRSKTTRGELLISHNTKKAIFEDTFNSGISNGTIKETLNSDGSKVLAEGNFSSSGSKVTLEETINSEGMDTKLDESYNSDVKLLFYSYENPSETDEMLNSLGSNTMLNLHKDDFRRGKKRKARVVAVAMAFMGGVAVLLLTSWYILFYFLGNVPEWKQDNFMIEAIPGLRYRPKGTYSEGTLIAFRSSAAEEYKVWTDIIDNFLEGYTNPNNFKNLYMCSYDYPSVPSKACYVDVKHLYPCVSENNYNYHRSSPCVFLKFNEIPNWTPEFYNDSKYLPPDMPTDLKNHIEHLQSSNRQLLNTVWVSCDGENAADKEFIGPLVYYPRRGFPGYFFPYTNQEGYLNPLVAIHFQRIMTGVIVNVECRLWAPNIEYDREKGRGYVHFELLID